jgi:formylglycine-generating enzyme required for sulfatase activity
MTKSKTLSRLALPTRTLLHKQFWIGRVLGMGGFGLTYLAWDDGLKIPVAVKEYYPKAFVMRDFLNLSVRPLSDEDQGHYQYGLQAFLNEAQTLAGFDHPHIIKPRYVFEENGTAYLVMDYLEGETLEEHLKRQPGKRLSQARALEILLPVMEGLAYVHRLGFIHRDIKPANIYLTRFAHDGKERSILLDFGAARQALGEHSQSLSMVYTPAYAAPEQYHTRGQGPWTDVYGLAATLYHATTGVLPQRAETRVLENNDNLRDPKELAPELTASFAGALFYGLTISSKRRPQTVEEFRRLLEASAEENKVDANPAESNARATGVGRSGEAPTEKAPHVPKKQEMTLKGIVEAIVVGLLVLILGGIVWFRFSEPMEEKISSSEAPKSPPAPPAKPSCAYCPEMVKLPAGSFTMGSNEGEGDEKPVHKVSVEAFSISKYEVTREQFAAFVEDSGYQAAGDCYAWNGTKWGLQADKNWRDPGFSQSGNHPVACVSFEDAHAYIRWLNGKTGGAYRLPKEAEWEYAARAGTETARYWGDAADAACRYANVADQAGKRTFNWMTIHNCDDGYVYTAPVGSFSPNRFGLHDMLGNVWEWTCSAYTDRYDGSEKACVNDAGARRVSRGGSWGSRPADVRSAARGGGGPPDRGDILGFRLAQD